MQKIEIIPACEEFIPSYHAALDEVAREKKYLCIIQAFPFYETELFIKDGIQKGYPYFFVIKDNKKVIGWCDIKPQDKKTGYLGVAVLKKYRRQGIGKKLIFTAIKGAVKYGFEKVELEVRASNIDAFKLYESLGFVKQKTLRNAVKVDGFVDDVYKMVLDLKRFN